jgi:hypothetical protein
MSGNIIKPYFDRVSLLAPFFLFKKERTYIMKRARTLPPQYLMELQRQNAAKQDFIGPAQSFHLDEDGTPSGITHLNTGEQ